MLSLADRIASSIGTTGGALEGAVFGTNRADEIASTIEAVVPGRTLGCQFYVSSVGCVTGLRLDDGSDVVVKIHQPRWSAAFLERALAVQTACTEAGLPAPRPLQGPRRCGAGLATVESHLPDPGEAAPTPGFLDVSAAGLATHIDVCRSLDLPEVLEPLARQPDRLYPVPHSPLFDFDATRSGAQWIDDIARRSRAVIDDVNLPRHTIHTDWAARNVRLSADGILAIYDWDSVSATSEPAAVGAAAQTWRSHGRWDERIAPAADEVHTYLDAYSHARGHPFTRTERQVAAATALWVLAYSARCEHSLAPDTGTGRCRRRLRKDHDRLLHPG